MSKRIDAAIQILTGEIKRETIDLQTIPKTSDNHDLIYAGNYRIRVMTDRLMGLIKEKKLLEKGLDSMSGYGDYGD